MAKKRDLPGFYEERKLLFDPKASADRKRRAGEAFMEAGRYDEALDFFERCGATDQVRQVAAKALAAGNTPLFMRAKRILREEVTDREWSQVAAAAEHRGAYTMAYVAHLKAGHEQEAARLRELAHQMDSQAASGPEGAGQGETGGS